MMPYDMDVDTEQEQKPRRAIDFDSALALLRPGGVNTAQPAAPVSTPPFASSPTAGPPAPEAPPKLPPEIMRSIGSAPPPATAGMTGASLPVSPSQPQRTMGQVMAGVTGQMPPAPPTPRQSGMTDLLKRQADLSKPVDPSQKQYRMGFGSRVLGTVANAARGFGGYHGEPVHVGPGATNQAYDNAEQQRTGELAGVQGQIQGQEKMEDSNRKLFDSAVKSAYESRIGDIRQQGADAKDESNRIREESSQNIADLKQQAQDLREQMRDNPQTVEKGVMQEIQKGDTVYDAKGNLVKAGPATRTWLKERRNQPVVNIRNGAKGDNPELNGMSAAEQREFVDRTRPIDRKINTVASAQTFRLSLHQDASDLDKQLDDLQKQRDAIRDEIISGRGKGSKAQSAADRIRARKAGAPPPTGMPAPVAPKSAPATNPATQPTAQKTITRAEIQTLADQHKVPYVDAEKQFTGKGYTVR